MKIAVFTKRTTFHKGYGGMETQNKLLCEGLASRGHKITVFSPKWQQEDAQAEEGGVNYIFIPCAFRMGPVMGFFGTTQKNNWVNRSYESFKIAHESEKFDLVLAQSSTGLGIIRHKKELNIPVVSIAHGSIIGEYKTFLNSMSFPRDLPLLIKNTGFTIKNFFRRQRDFVHGSNKIIAVSNFVRDSLIDETYVDENKVVVIHNGINPKLFYSKDDKVDRQTKLLYVGQVSKSKGVNDIIEILKDPRCASLSVDIVGDGDILEFLKRKVSTVESMRDRVRFLGKVSYTEIVERYYKNKEYGVFILPTKRYEGLPMVLVEALFSALPTVVYNTGGVRDAVLSGKTGFLIEHFDKEAAINKILEITANTEIRNLLGIQSLEFAYANFTLETMLNKYEAVFMEALS